MGPAACVAGAALLVSAWAAPTLAQDGQQRDDKRWVATWEELELRDLLDACAAALDLSLDYERGKVEGKVTLRTGEGLTNESLWALTNRQLASRGLACIHGPGEDSLAVVELDKAAKLARVEVLGPFEARAGFIKVLETLESAEPQAVVEVLGKVLTGEGSLVQALPATRQVLLAGLKPQVVEALHVLDAIDTPEPRVAVETVPVMNVAPATLVALLDRITASRTKVDPRGPAGTLLAHPHASSLIVVAPEPDIAAWRALVQQFDAEQGSVTVDYAPRRFGLDETAELIEEVVRPRGTQASPTDEWRIVRDRLTATLIITATYAQHLEIEALLGRLEGASADTRRTVRSFPVRHRDVDELLDLLQGLLERGAIAELVGEEAGDAEQPTPEGGTGGRPRPLEPEGWEVTLTSDAGTNRIVALGEARMLDELGRLIESLDVQHPQVLVEALVVTLSEAQSRDLAVELQAIGDVGSGTGRLASLFGLGSPNPAGSTIGPATGTGFEGVVLDPGDYSGAIRALETLNDGRSITVPKVLVNNHQTATLSSVLQTPYTSTNASTTVATTSFGGTLDAGTTVTVTPQITDGDRLLLDYAVSLSNFVGDSADPNIPPPRQETSLESKATVPDGYAVVVGGLEIASEDRAESRVPLLGAIPILGNLFKSQSKNRTKSRLFVFLRCSVLRSPQFADLQYLSTPDLDVAGIDGDWPEVAPRLIR